MPDKIKYTRIYNRLQNRFFKVCHCDSPIRGCSKAILRTHHFLPIFLNPCFCECVCLFIYASFVLHGKQSDLNRSPAHINHPFFRKKSVGLYSMHISIMCTGFKQLILEQQRFRERERERKKGRGGEVERERKKAKGSYLRHCIDIGSPGEQQIHH